MTKMMRRIVPIDIGMPRKQLLHYTNALACRGFRRDSSLWVLRRSGFNWNGVVTSGPRAPQNASPCQSALRFQRSV